MEDGRDEDKKTKKLETLQVCSSCGLHLLCSKQWILRPLWGLTWWGIPSGALQLQQRLQELHQCSLTFRRHNQTFHWLTTASLLPAKSVTSICFFFYLSQTVAQKITPANFSSLKCVQFLGIRNKKKYMASSKISLSQILCVLCTSKIGSAVTQLRTGTEWGGC